MSLSQGSGEQRPPNSFRCFQSDIKFKKTSFPTTWCFLSCDRAVDASMLASGKGTDAYELLIGIHSQTKAFGAAKILGEYKKVM